MNERTRAILLLAAIAVIAGAIAVLSGGKAAPSGDVVREEAGGMRNAAKELLYEKAAEIAGASGYLNTGGSPITIGEFVGKDVVLVDFWTYSCINCQRTLPYLNAWHEKYKDKGLQIISIHTPEFEFEKDPENVRRAAEKFGVEYPIVQDNAYATWRAYGNRYWPRKYLVDIDGYVAYDHIGEGAYEETERKIQELLDERAKALGMADEIERGVVAPKGTYAVGDVGSPETYFGSLRNRNFGSGPSGVSFADAFERPETPERNTLYLAGPWRITDEFAENSGAGSVIFRYRAKNVYIVASGGQGVRASVFLDGTPIAPTDAGASVAASILDIKEDQLYHVVAHPGDSEEHVLEIRVENPGLRMFTFTFG